MIYRMRYIFSISRQKYVGAGFHLWYKSAYRVEQEAGYVSIQHDVCTVIDVEQCELKFGQLPPGEQHYEIATKDNWGGALTTIF